MQQGSGASMYYVWTRQMDVETIRYRRAGMIKAESTRSAAEPCRTQAPQRVGVGEATQSIASLGGPRCHSATQAAQC